MDAKQRKMLMIRLGAGGAIMLALLLLGWFLFFPSSKKAVAAPQLGPSDQMAPLPPTVAPTSAGGQVVVLPSQVTFAADTPGTSIFTIKASGGPVVINDVQIPTTDADALKVQNIDCPAPPALLPANGQCTAAVTWTGSRSVNSVITIHATGNNSGAAAQQNGPQSTVPTMVPVSAVSTHPVPLGPNGQPLPAGAPANGAVGSLPSQSTPVPPPSQGPGASGSGAPGQAATGMSPLQAAREAYLQARRGGGIQIANAPLQAAARSPYTSWENIGVQGQTSSFPVDMTHVITPDKPLSAVLTLPIDTRAVVTAVAMVDRDIYGNNGRTVVIPRGTKIIGKVSGGAVDRVGIAWNQIIRPDGVRFLFDGESGDAMGRGGVPGRINNRYLQRYGYSLVPNAIGAGLTAALGGQTSAAAGGFGATQTQDARAVAAQILNQPLSEISRDIAQKNKDIPVQITVPAGTRITIWSVGDLRLKPVGENDDPRGSNGSANSSGFAGGGSGRVSFQAPAQPTASERPSNAARGSNVESDRDGSALQVGHIDASGNYIAPGANAPAPGPITTTGSNPPVATAGQMPRNATFRPSSAPWQ